ncbi:hypothetical protein KVR01_002396 [Diaporthe batatas]|uniref:uncharacterized protein n=1 Tax=Diaporthe batatas TaxID=748121 RepID=UPI001D0436C7|nr:uncharacterized protein KVR01_002396 [Diaporthe batatas]KAG8166707.1 hypothetical protein KVR01_002396 [Diaporthe batatas]
MCNRPLVLQEIEEFADSYTFKTYLSHMIDRTVNDMPNFTRCPMPDCGSGQVHEGGDAHPFVTCAACNTQFCFRHGIPTQPRPEQQAPSQHENMTCDEYDSYLADPTNFRSDHQRQQERAAVERREEEAVTRARERMEKILERRREAAAAAAAAAEEERRIREERAQMQNAARLSRERREREQRQKQVELRERLEREAREERARLEARRYAEERERAETERRARAEEVLRRKVEDENSEKWIEFSAVPWGNYRVCTVFDTKCNGCSIPR